MNCPICYGDDIEWDQEGRFFRCGTCLRVFDYYDDTCIWWPNDQAVEAPGWINWPEVEE